MGVLVDGSVAQRLLSPHEAADATGPNSMQHATDKLDNDGHIITRAMSAGAIGALFALAAFVVSIIAGLYSYNDAATILLRGLMAMIVCYPIGLLIGVISQWVITTHVKKYIEENPVPEFDDAMPPSMRDDVEVQVEDGEEVIVV